MGKLNYQNKILILLILLFGLLFLPSRVEAVAITRTVCPDPVGSCSPSDPSFVGAPGIILAITASTNGDTVSIKNGTYSGFAIDQQGDYNYFIVLTKNLTITGESTNGTILSGAGANKASMFLVNNTGDSSISNLTISGFQVITCPATPCSYGAGIEVEQTGSATLSLSNLKIIGDGDVNIDDTGIWSYGSSKVTIANSTIYSSNSGVFIQGTSNLNITSCTIHSNVDGIAYKENTTGIISSTTVYGNGDGITYAGNATGTISGSTIRNNTEDGVITFASAVVAVNNNLIYSNTRVGLRLFNNSNVTGSGNTIYSNLYTGHASGVYCSESAVLGTWTNNNVWNNVNGNYGSDPVGLCTDKTGTNGNISVDPQSLLSTSSTSSSPTLPDTAIEENSFLKIILSFIALCIGIVFLSRHFDTISKEDN